MFSGVVRLFELCHDAELVFWTIALSIVCGSMAKPMDCGLRIVDCGFQIVEYIDFQ
jgi:hypothetical protein